MTGIDDQSDVDLTARLAKRQARILITRIITASDSFVSFTRHARTELANDSMDAVDALNILRAGQIHEEGELKNGTWRYRVHTEKFCVVVAFRNPHQLVVITAWRKQR